MSKKHTFCNTTDFSIEDNEKTTLKTSEKILLAIRENPNILREELAEMLNLTIDGVNWQIRKLKNHGLLRRVGSDKSGYWEVLDILQTY